MDDIKYKLPTSPDIIEKEDSKESEISVFESRAESSPMKWPNRPIITLINKKDDYTETLFKMLHNKNVDEFINTIQSHSGEDKPNVNCSDGWSTYLQLACWAGNAKLVKYLLNSGADLNAVGSKYSYPPVMEAGRRGHLNIIRLIVERGNPEQLMSGHSGVNILHLIIDSVKFCAGGDVDNYVQCLSYVLKALKEKYPFEYKGVVNEEHENLGTPLEYAECTSENKRIIAELVKYDASVSSKMEKRTYKLEEIFIDMYVFGTESKPMEMKSRPNVKVVNQQDKYTDKLVKMLDNHEFGEFVSAIEVFSGEVRPDMNCCDGLETYLQYACAYEDEGVVHCLLNAGADLDVIGHIGTFPPIMIAGLNGHMNIIQLIIERGHPEQLITGHRGRNVLHEIIKSVLTYYADNSEEVEVYVHFLKNILQMLKKHHPSDYRAVVNEANKEYGTPLELAAPSGDEGMVMALLEHGASIFVKDKRGNFIFSNLSAKTIEEFLNKCLTYKRSMLKDTITFNYEFTASPSEVCSETEPLLHMSRSPEARHLLQHPVLASFIDMKWQKVSRFYKYIAAFYLVYLVCITSYALLPDNGTDEQDSCVSVFSLLLNIIIVIFLIISVAVETWQAKVLGLEYVGHLENWAEITLIVLTALMITDNRHFHQEISAVIVLLAWTDVILLIGRHPDCSEIVEMYKKVTLTFVKFLSCYSFFVFAFVLSFYILSRESKPKVSTIHDLAMAMFNAMLSLAGIHDPDYIPFDDHPGISHALYLTFVVLICVNLLNLLNGLAVSDTQTIIKEAELVGLMYRVNFIFLIEKMAFYPFKAVFGSVNLFDDARGVLSDYTIKCVQVDRHDDANWVLSNTSGDNRDITLKPANARSALEIWRKGENLDDVLKCLKVNSELVKDDLKCRNEELMCMKYDMKSIKNDFKSLKEDFKLLHEDFKCMKEDSKSIMHDFSKSIMHDLKKMISAIDHRGTKTVEENGIN